MSRPPRPRGYAYDPSIRVTQCALGLTLYTRHLASDPAGGVARLLTAYLERAPLDELRLFRTGLTPSWKRVRPNELGEIVEELSGRALSRRPRLLFELHLADAPDAPSVFFSYREVDESRGAGCGYVQLGLPVDTPSETLLELATAAAHTTPLWCGVGGYLATLHPTDACTSLSAVWAWAKRYWGLDVQQPDRARLHAEDGLPSVNWLSLVGDPLLAKHGLSRPPLAERAAELDVTWIDAERAAIVRAGDEPTLADANRMEDAAAYRRAHALLTPVLLEAPVRLYGRFWEDEAATRWCHRYSDPEAWNS